VLADWSRTRSGFSLITQNVDGLHERAGTDSVIRLHGSIWHLRCWNGCEAGRTDWHDDTAPFNALPPRCPHCEGMARPAVVWFGESLDPHVLHAASDACACDVFLTIGTSANVYPAAGLVPQAKALGAFTVEINPDATGASGIVDVSIRGNAETVLPDLQQRLAHPLR